MTPTDPKADRDMPHSGMCQRTIDGRVLQFPIGQEDEVRAWVEQEKEVGDGD